MQLSVRELTETVVLYKDRLEVTLSKSIAETLKTYRARLFFLSNKAAQRWEKKQGYFK